MTTPLVAAADALDAATEQYQVGDNVAARRHLQRAVGALEQAGLHETAALVVSLAREQPCGQLYTDLEQLADLCVSWTAQREVAV